MGPKTTLCPLLFFQMCLQNIKVRPITIWYCPILVGKLWFSLQREVLHLRWLKQHCFRSIQMHTEPNVPNLYQKILVQICVPLHPWHAPFYIERTWCTNLPLKALIYPSKSPFAVTIWYILPPAICSCPLLSLISRETVICMGPPI